MKRRSGRWCLCILFAMVMLFGCCSLARAAKPKAIELDKAMRYDLNGGKKEKIKVALEEVEGESVTNVYAGGERIYTKGYPESPVVHLSAALIDANKKDKYKEILLTVTGLNGNSLDNVILRYYSAAKVKIWVLEPNRFPGRVTRKVSVYSYDGNKGFMVLVDTPFQNLSFGCYKVLVPAELTATRLYLKTSSSYKWKQIHQILFENEGWYTLHTSMGLYESPSISSDLESIPAGTRFMPKYIKTIRQEEYNWELFVKIKTSKGQKGWLLFPLGSNADVLEEIPAWG